MKPLFICILSIFFFLQCSSQKKISTPALRERANFENAEVLKGKWYKTQYFILQNGTKRNLVDACVKKSFWELSSDKSVLLLEKVTYSGANCNFMNSQRFKNGTLSNGNLQYLDHDVLQNIYLEKLSEKSFKITETTLIEGKTAEIVTVFLKE